MNYNIVLVGDFNIDLVNLLDYIITRKDCNIISDCTVSDFISDHRVHHASLQCIRPHPVRKQIAVRALRRIKDDAFAEDLDMLQRRIYMWQIGI